MKTFLVFLFFSCCMFSQRTTDIVAEIETKEFLKAIKIRGTVTNRSNVIRTLRYEMFVYRKNFKTSEIAKADNRGRVVVKPNQKINLAELDINKLTKDKITVVVLVYDEDDKIIGKARRVVLNSDETNNSTNNIQSKSIGLRGLITENVKTKPGRDFYIEFSLLYRLKRINGREVVKIIEQFSFGRSTIMEVHIGNTVIYRFFVQPQLDFIKKQAQNAINQVIEYFIKLDKQKNYIRQY